MAFEPRRMEPAKLCQLLNSNPFIGEVVTLARLRKHRIAAGFRISADGDTVDFLRYVAWLVTQWHAKKHDLRKGRPPGMSVDQWILELERLDAVEWAAWGQDALKRLTIELDAEHARTAAKLSG